MLVAASAGKAFNLHSEESRATYWRSFEADREKFYPWAADKIRRQFRAEMANVQANLLPESATALVWIMIASDWRQTLTEIYRNVGRHFAARTAAALPQKSVVMFRRKDLEEVWYQAIEDYIAATVADRVVLITQTTKDLIKAAIQAGIDAGEGVYELKQRIGRLYLDDIIPHRAETIARTETIGASNAASTIAAEATGLKLNKSWLSTRDSRVRDTHAAADGQIVPMSEPFSVGGSQLMFPGDSSLGADAREIVNCRCTLTFSVAK